MLRKIILKSVLLFIVFFGTSFSITYAEVPQAIKDAIDKKAAELQQIVTQVKETQKQLDEVKTTGRSLQNEIGQIDQNIKQIDLGIKSSKVTIEKLGYEIESLEYNIDETAQSIDEKKAVIAQTFQEIQKRSDETSLTIFLKGQTLADSISEMQSLSDLNAGLQKNINELKQAKDHLNKIYSDQTNKKKQKEIENYNLKNKKVILDETRNDRAEILQVTKSKEKVYQEIMSALDKKQQDIANEIDALEKELRKSLDVKELPKEQGGVLSCPVSDGCLINQDYGYTKSAKVLYKSGFHNGIDFKAAAGTPILAAADGSIMATGNNGKLQYGRYVVIRHENGLATLYAHLSLINVNNGQDVHKGDVIGYSGGNKGSLYSGYSTGPHLHFGVYWAPEVKLQPFPGAGLVPVGPTVNPKDYL